MESKVTRLLTLLSVDALEELQTKLEMAYTQECLRYCDDIMVHGQGGNVQRVKDLWELNCSINELRAS